MDVYCLGVKNALFNVYRGYGCENMKSTFVKWENSTYIHQSYARKLVEGAVTYAKGLGFSPHKNYTKSKQIFDDIDPGGCPKSFTFGKDGKRLFISGPDDTPATNNRVIDTLARRLGTDGFHFMAAFSEDDMGNVFRD